LVNLHTNAQAYMHARTRARTHTHTHIQLWYLNTSLLWGMIWV